MEFQMKISHALSLFAVTASVACSTVDDSRPAAPRFARVDVVQDDVKSTVVASDADGAELSRALLRRDHEVARIEVEADGERFLAELEPRSGELTIHAEVDGASTSWSPSSGEAMPEVIAERWTEITAQWRSTLLDDDGALRDDYRKAVNVPADLFGTPDADVPVAASYWCPPEPQCWYDEVGEVQVCIMLHQVWCPPPPPPCGELCLPDPCWGLNCTEPCTTDRWCDPPCIGLWCNVCQPWDPFCVY
jgi:hypothetical protein